MHPSSSTLRAALVLAGLLLTTSSPAQVLGLGGSTEEGSAPLEAGDELAGAEARPEALGGGTHRRSLRIGRVRRTYQVRVPEGERPRAGWPVVVAYHGNFMNGGGMAGMSELHELGAEEGFVTVYPDGTGIVETARSWNAGDCCLEAQLRGVDDMGYADALLDALVAEVPADPRRVYVVGFSNGGMLAYELLDRYADRIAAAAMVAAVSFVREPRPSRPVPFLHVHGTADPYVPYAGSQGRLRIGFPSMPPVRRSVERWIRAYGGAVDSPRSRHLEGDASHVEHRTWPGVEGGAEVQLYTVGRGGHSWPGGPAFATRILGEPDPALEASLLIWEFLRRFRLPEPATD